MPEHKLPDIIEQTLRQFQHQQWVKHSFRCLLFMLTITFISMSLLCIGDAFLHWSDFLRYACACIFWAFVFWTLIRSFILPFLRRPPLLKIASNYERQFPDHLHNQISSAVSFCDSDHPGVSPWMMQRCIATATQTLNQHAQSQKHDQTPHQRSLMIMVLLWLTLFIPPAIRTYVLRSGLPWLNIPRPTAVSFVVNPGNIKVSSGTDVVVEVKTFPPVNTLECAISWNDGHQEILSCQLSDENTQTWRLDLGPTLESFSYTLRSDNAESPRYQVNVGAAAQISDTHIQVTPPHYITKSIRQISSGDTDALNGSQLQFYARMRHFDLHHATLVGENDWRLPLEVEQTGDGFIVSGEWQAEHTQHYSLHLWNNQGLHHQHPQQWFIRVIDDLPPQLSVTIPLSSYAISGNQDTVLVQVKAEDDFAVESMRLRFGNQDGEYLQQDIEIKQSQKTLSLEFPIDLNQWHFSIGDRLWVELDCLDIAGQSQISKRQTWTIGQNSHVQLARQSQIMKYIVTQLTTLQTRSSLLASRWSNIRSNFRVDDMNAQSGDLLQADQQMLSIQKSLAEILRHIAEVRNNVDGKRYDPIEWLDSLSQFTYQQHCMQFTNRGAQVLQTSNTELASVLENSVTDSELLNNNINQLLSFAYAIDALFTADTLEQSCLLYQGHIEESFNQLRSTQLWQTPLYSDKLRCSIFNNTALKDKPIITDYRPVAVQDLQIPDFGGNNFSIRWKGDLFIPQDGQWTFNTTSDDGVQIRIDDQDLLSKDAWKEQPPTAFSSTLTLNTGWHQIEINYFQGSGSSSLNLELGLKDTPAVNINEFNMRSPEVNQISDQILLHMLSNKPLGKPHWEQGQQAIRQMLNCALIMHEWASNLSQSRLHRTAQAFTKSCDPYKDLFDHPPLEHSLQQNLDWKQVSLSQNFNDARDLIQEKIKQWQIPIERKTPIDDLIIHIHQMDQLSKSLKDWGLPYEHIAQTYRFLNRSKEQAIALFNRSISQLSQIASNSQLSTGERSIAWMINSALQVEILNKINGIEIDNHNILWQLPALQKSLMDIYHKTSSWRNYFNSAPYSALSLSETWMEQNSNDIASWYAHEAYLRALKGTIGNNTSLETIQKNAKAWTAFNASDPGQATAVLEEFIQKSLKIERNIDGRDLKHLWQIALIDAERAFSLHQQNRAQAALSIAISLQDHLESKNIPIAELKKIAQTAKLIANGKKQGADAFIDSLLNNDDPALQHAIQLQIAQLQLSDSRLPLSDLVNTIKQERRFSINLQSLDSWRQDLKSQSEKPIKTIPSILRHYTQRQEQGRLSAKTLIQRLLDSSADQNTKQGLRWKSLAKDLESALLSAPLVNEPIPLAFVNAFFQHRAQLTMYSQEQAAYTRRRLASFESEDEISLDLLNGLASLEADYQNINQDFLLELQRLSYIQNVKLHTVMKYHWQLATKMPLVENESAKKTWDTTNSVINKSQVLLENLQLATANTLVKYNPQMIKQWQDQANAALHFLNSYWANIVQRQELLSQQIKQNRSALLTLYSDIDVIHLNILLHIHQHYQYLKPEHKIWTLAANTINSFIADITIRLQSLPQEMLVIQYHAITPNDPVTDIVEVWHQAPYFESVKQISLQLQQFPIDANVDYLAKLQTQSNLLVDLSFAQAARLLHQQGQHVYTPLSNDNAQLTQDQQTPIVNFQRLFEQQWQHGKMLVEMHLQYENYDVFNATQQLLIYDYFNMINASSP